MGELIGACPIRLVHLPEIFLLHYYHVHSSHRLLYLLPVLQGHEGDEKPAGVKKEEYERREHLYNESHFIPGRILLRIIILFPLAKREIFQMQALNELHSRTPTFEG